MLLDTRALLWWVSDHPRLSSTAREAIDSADQVWVSSATAWEIATKTRIGKLSTKPDLSKSFSEIVSAYGFRTLDITCQHAQRAAGYPHDHKDPFDRMLAAQAHLEAMTLVTLDPVFDRFDVDTLW
nr:type II toxin-antitoxin system VapC family toxin [Sediminivirga luteola]